MTSCLVTGASGFVGQHLVRAALVAGFHLVGMLHQTDGNDRRELYQKKRRMLSLPESHRRLTLVEGSLQDRSFVRRTFDQTDVDAVVHLAGITRVPEAKKRADAALAVNVEGTRILVEEADRRARSRRRPMHFLFASTARVFEGTMPSEIAADGAKTPSSMYARSKVLAEETLGGRPDLETTITYAPNFFGTGESLTVIPIWISAALAGQTISVWGDGAAEVSFTRVEDYCTRLLAILRRPAIPSVLSRVLEPGEHQVSLNELAISICASLDRMVRQGKLDPPPQGGSYATLIRHVAHEV